MKKDMPLEGLRWSRDSGSALYDTPQNGRSRTGWGGAILASSSFFIYCCHDLFLPFLKSVIAIDENNEFWRYLIVVGTDLVLCLLLYKIVVWVFPKTSKYLTGGR